MASDSLFCERWSRKTIKKVMIVVAVLITSCQVLLNSNIGPVINQTMIDARASPNAQERPVQSVASRANRSKTLALRMAILRGMRDQCGSEYAQCMPKHTE